MREPLVQALDKRGFEAEACRRHQRALTCMMFSEVHDLKHSREERKSAFDCVTDSYAARSAAMWSGREISCDTDRDVRNAWLLCSRFETTEPNAGKMYCPTRSQCPQSK